MRVVFVGASPLAVTSIGMLTEKGHEAVLIDKNKEKLDRLSDTLDCGFVCEDGSRPHVLREVGADSTDVLYCLSDDDQDNIIASLVGRELGFKRVVTKIEDADFESICHELGLEDPIVPSRQMAEHLVDLAQGRETAGLSTVLRSGLRFFTYIAEDAHAGPLAELDLGCDTRVVAVTRDDRSLIPSDDTVLKAGDEIALIVHEKDLEALAKRVHTAGE